MDRKPCTQDVLDLVEGLSGVVAELERRLTVLEQRQVQFPNLSRVFNADVERKPSGYTIDGVPTYWTEHHVHIDA